MSYTITNTNRQLIATVEDYTVNATALPITLIGQYYSNFGGMLIPLPELARRISELDAHQKIVTICKMGPRGAKATKLLHDAGFEQVWNLTGGIHAWSDRVDHSVPKY